MKHQPLIFDQCQTKSAIHRQLQHLTCTLLAAVGKYTHLMGDDLGGEHHLALDVLSELSYADLKNHDYPVVILSEICRLLFKLGDHASLKRALTLSHTLYAFKCRNHESWYISYLYKGMAQIGLHLTDLGIKNVLTGLSEQTYFPIMPVDRVLGYWALMSACILKKNLKLAHAYAQTWYDVAQSSKLRGEIFRARIVQHLLHLLFGDTQTCDQDIAGLVADTPKEWMETVQFLQDWTSDMNSHDQNSTEPPKEFIEPYPLFLGIDWHFPPESIYPEDSGYSRDDTPEVFSSADFQLLCRVRRSFYQAEIIETLSVETIEAYATCLAQWELPRPLYDFETILKNKAVEKNLHYIMTRLLGKRVLDKVVNQTPLDPNVVTQQDAVIFVMDVRKFSALSENRTPEEIFEILNPIFKIVNNELEQADGTILEFIGDCIIIVFNTFRGQDTNITEILSRTVRCLQQLHVHNAMAVQAGLPEVQIGIGINKGPVALGYLGGLDRCHLTVLGNTINLATRIESSTKELPGNVIVSGYCFEHDTPDVWNAPGNVNFSLRDLGLHTMRNITRPVHLFGLHPLLRYWIDFVPMGFVAHPERGVVYLDTGNSTEPGIIDHHYGAQTARSACELLNMKPELLLEHIKDVPDSQREFRLHSYPDFDCAATLYTAYELMSIQPRTDLLSQLATYASHIDQGTIPHPETLESSLYGIFIAHQTLIKQQAGKALSDFQLLEAGLRVVDAAFYALEAHGGDLSCVFRHNPSWFSEEARVIREDRELYAEDVRLRGHAYRAHINDAAEPVFGLWLDHPRSIFGKLWATIDPTAPEGQGYQFLAFNFSQPDRNRFIIRVDPESGINLNGLGQLLEYHESRKRKALGKERPTHPIRYPADNSDPWYFGQGHQYTIIDSPWEGSVLTAEEVQKIHENWQE
jgi:class 3 adenylate cyclase